MTVNIPDKLRAIRDAARYPSREMAKYFGVSKRTYDYWEAGELPEDPKKVGKIKETIIKFESEKLHNNVQPITLISNSGCEQHEIEIQRLQKEVKILEKVIDLKERLEPPEGVMERLTRLEYSMKYVLKFISNEHEYRRSLKYIDVPLNDMSICISNAEGRLEYVNDEFTNQTGYTLDEVLGKKPGDVLQGKKTERKVVGSISEAIKSKKRFEGEIINYNKMGDEITCKLIIAPMLDRNGQVEKLISLAIFIK